MVKLHLNKILDILKKYLPGLIFVSFIGILANNFSSPLHIGAVALSIIFGFIINNLFPIPNLFKPGIVFTEKRILNLAIVLLGVQLSFKELQKINVGTILIIVLLIIISIILAMIIGKILKLSKESAILVGIGNGICGSSAIAGASSILDSKKEDIGLSISAINFIGAIGIFLVPEIIQLFNITDVEQQSIIIGGTIQAVGQVTAAGFIMGDEVGKLATFIKMIRILMLGPMLIILGLMYSKGKANASHPNNLLSKIKSIFIVPPFIIGFIFLSIMKTQNIIPLNIENFLIDFSKYCLILAMVAIGLQISIPMGHRNELMENSGTANLVASLMNESTENYTIEQITQQLETLGSEINVSASKENITIFIKSLEKNFDKTLKILEEIIFKPGFYEADFNRIKKTQLESIENQSTDASIIANNIFNVLLYGGDHIYSTPNIGTSESVQNISLDNARNYYTQYFSPTKAKIVIVGSIDKKTALSKLLCSLSRQ